MKRDAFQALDNFYAGVRGESTPIDVGLPSRSAVADTVLGACTAVCALLILSALASSVGSKQPPPMVVGAEAYAALVEPPAPKPSEGQVRGELWTTRLA